MEVHFYIDSDGDGFAISGGGGKSPLLHGIDGCLVELRTKCARDFDVAWKAVGMNNKL
jgi:hypothetical protein